MQTINEVSKRVHKERPHLLIGGLAFTEAIVEEYTKELNDNFKELELLLAAKESKIKEMQAALESTKKLNLHLYEKGTVGRNVFELITKALK